MTLTTTETLINQSNKPTFPQPATNSNQMRKIWEWNQQTFVLVPQSYVLKLFLCAHCQNDMSQQRSGKMSYPLAGLPSRARTDGLPSPMCVVSVTSNRNASSEGLLEWKRGPKVPYALVFSWTRQDKTTMCSTLATLGKLRCQLKFLSEMSPQKRI